MTPKYKFGYARVSTLEQDEALQHDALSAAGCERIFADKASGKLEHRPALDALLDQLRPGDTVVVWRLDRLGRSLRHLIDVVNELERRGQDHPHTTLGSDSRVSSATARPPRSRPSTIRSSKRPKSAGQNGRNSSRPVRKTGVTPDEAGGRRRGVGAGIS